MLVNDMDRRVLIITNTIDCGGAEAFVMKVFRCLKPKGYTFDFLINNRKSNFYEEEISQLGGSIFYGCSKSRSPLKSFQTVYQTVKAGQYKTIFCISTHPLGFLDLLAAKLAGAKKRLIRSTTSKTGGAMPELFIEFSRLLVRHLATSMLAPSTEAAIWLFGEKPVQKGRVHIITNGVDINDYHYDEKTRRQTRAQLGVAKQDKVIGHIGRFSSPKNHKFLIDVFADIHTKDPDTILLLVGGGELEPDIRQQIQKRNISEAVKFLGVRNDVYRLLMAMDVMIFPSFYEGLPNVVIEAQAVGLPCLISDTISSEVKITELVSFLSLDKGIAAWTEAALSCMTIEHRDTSTQIEESGYTIQRTACFLEKLLG